MTKSQGYPEHFFTQSNTRKIGRHILSVAVISCPFKPIGFRYSDQSVAHIRCYVTTLGLHKKPSPDNPKAVKILHRNTSLEINY